MSAPFSFVCTDNKRKSVINKPEIADCLKKWSLKTALNIQYYSFNDPFQIYQKQDFAEVLVNEEDDNWNVFSEAERLEFLIRLVRLLVVGGQWCQYEDVLQPYLQTAVAIYKDLISAHKDSETGRPTVHSVVLEVEARRADGKPLLPLAPQHLQDEAYLCIDPDQRTCAVLTHHSGGYFH